MKISKINLESEKNICDKKYKNKKKPKFSAADAFITIKDHKKNFLLTSNVEYLTPEKTSSVKLVKPF